VCCRGFAGSCSDDLGCCGSLLCIFGRCV
jgi:hypothetical protein